MKIFTIIVNNWKTTVVGLATGLINLLIGFGVFQIGRAHV